MSNLRADVIGVAIECAVCGNMKKPVGRSAPMGVAYCTPIWPGEHGCPGYYEVPRSGSLWPGESEADFGYPVGDVGIRRRG